MPSFVVRQRGVDSSGRPILATDFFWVVWCALLSDKRLASFADRIVIVQGSFMARAGGGAAESAGYHDLAGAVDTRVWNLTRHERDLLWAVAAEYGIWFWERGPAAYMGGMDEHGHGIAGWDYPCSEGVKAQWRAAVGRRDGLAGNGPDYMHRPHPVVLYPPTDLLTQEDYMESADAKNRFDRLEKAVDDLTDLVAQGKNASWKRDKKASEMASRQVAMLGGVVDALTELATEEDLDKVRKRLGALRKTVLEHLAADPDVDGADNPAAEATTQES